MLVFSRKIGESFYVKDETIQIKILRVSSNGIVKIGVEAPEEVRILREEVLKKEKPDL